VRGGRLQPARDSKLPSTAYTHGSINVSYDRLRGLADAAICSGYRVIVDATFLKARHRRLFLELADASPIPARILDFHACGESLAARIQARTRIPRTFTDVDGSVLLRQLANEDPLTHDELARTFSSTPTCLARPFAN
jgi:uncharacterized protein